MFWVIRKFNCKLIFHAFLLYFVPVIVNSSALQNAPQIKVTQQGSRTSLILVWPEKVLTEHRREGRNLILTFDKPIRNNKITTIPRLLPGAVESTDYGYDSLLLRLVEGVGAQVVPLADGVRIEFAVEVQKGSTENLRVKYLRALALYNERQIMEARRILQGLVPRQPDDADITSLLAEIEDRLGRGTVALNLLNDFAAATGETMAPWTRQQQQYLRRLYGDKLQADSHWEHVQNEETQWITRLSDRYNTPKNNLSLALLAENRWIDVDAVQRSDGSVSSFKGARQWGQLELRKDWVSAQGSVLYLSAASNGVGVGGGIRHEIGSNFGVTGLSALFNQPFYEFAVSTVDDGTRDRFAIDHKARLGNWLMGDFGVSLERYGIAGESDVARAVGVAVNLQYALLQGKPYIALDYSLFGRYVTQKEEKINADGEIFEPFPLESVEIHSAGLSLSQELFRKFTYNLSSGYSVDRLSGSGVFGDVSLTYEPTDRLRFGLSASAYPRLDRRSDAMQFDAGGYLAVNF